MIVAAGTARAIMPHFGERVTQYSHAFPLLHGELFPKMPQNPQIKTRIKDES